MRDTGMRDTGMRNSEGRGSGNLRSIEPSALHDWIDLLARISHDLRTPLNAVIGFSDAMQNEMFGPLGHSRYQEYARHIRSSGDQLLKAAEDTLAMTSLLTQPKSASLDDVRLAGPLRAAVAAIEAQARERSVEIETAIDGEAMVRGDERILPRALQHLLAAALARAVAGQRIAVATTAAHDRIRLTIEVGTPDRRPLHGQGCEGDGRPRASAGRAAERGLGREDLSIWLARLLLAQQDCALSTEAGPDHLVIVAEFDEAMQADFFTRRG